MRSGIRHIVSNIVRADHFPGITFDIVRLGHEHGSAALIHLFVGGFLGDLRLDVILGKDRQLGGLTFHTFLGAYKTAVELTTVHCHGNIGKSQRFGIITADGQGREDILQPGTGNFSNSCVIGDHHPFVLLGVVGPGNKGSGLSLHNFLFGRILGNHRGAVGIRSRRLDGDRDHIIDIAQVMGIHRHLQGIAARLCGGAFQEDIGIGINADTHTRNISAGHQSAVDKVLSILKNLEHLILSLGAGKALRLRREHRDRQCSDQQSQKQQHGQDSICLFHKKLLLLKMIFFSL